MVQYLGIEGVSRLGTEGIYHAVSGTLAAPAGEAILDDTLIPSHQIYSLNIDKKNIPGGNKKTMRQAIERNSKGNRADVSHTHPS